MFDFVDDLFDEWTITSWIVWIVLSVGTIYVAWFVQIPSALSDRSGFPISVKFGVTIVIPIVTWWMLNNKEATADIFGKRSK